MDRELDTMGKQIQANQRYYTLPNAGANGCACITVLNKEEINSIAIINYI